MAESSAIPALPGLVLETVEWLPSGMDAGLVRVRGRWLADAAREQDLPKLVMRAAGAEHHFESLPDARFSRDPDRWRGTYLVAADLVATDPEAMWIEWPTGTRAGLPALVRGPEPPRVPAPPERPEEPDQPGGQVIDRAVLAERRARRAEAAEQAQARATSEALKAVEVLELRSVELERRLEAASAARQAAAEPSEDPGRAEALAAALATAAELRARAREWQLRLRTSEVARGGEAVRVAVLEAERTTATDALRSALDERTAELTAAREASEAAARDLAAAHARDLAATREASEAAARDLAAADSRLVEAREAWDRRREALDAELTSVRGRLDEAGAEADARLAAHAAEIHAARTGAEEQRARADDLEATLAAVVTRLRGETTARETLELELGRARGAHAVVAELREELEGSAAEVSGLRDRLGAADAAAGDLRAQLEAARAESADLHGRLEHAHVAAADLHDRLQDGQAERAALERRLDEARAEAERSREEAGGLRAELEREREARRAAGVEAEQTLQARLAAHAADLGQAGPPADAGRMVADLDAAADALRRRASLEPPAPDAEPGIEADARDDAEPPAPDAEPGIEADAPEDAEPPAPDAEPGIEADAPEDAEPPAPDAEPGIEADAPEDAEPRGPVEPGVAPVPAGVEAAEPEPVLDAREADGPEPVAPDAELVAEDRREADDLEPAAPDAEPASEWRTAPDRPEAPREPVEPAVEPVRARSEEYAARWGWLPPGVDPTAHEAGEDEEPPAPDAEPGVEWAMPPTGPVEPAALAPRRDEPAPLAAAVSVESESADVESVGSGSGEAGSGEVESVEVESVGSGSVDSGSVDSGSDDVVFVEPAPAEPVPASAGPRIVPASRPPARAHAVGSSRRDYPLLRGAIVKLAHDDPALAGRLLAALLPAQGLVIEGPLSYDLSIGGTGTFGVSITGGRAFVRALDEPRPRSEAEFHLQAAPLVLAEMLAGVEHRVGRFFGAARVRGRKRRAKALRALPTSAITLTEAARAGAQLEPELVYRLLAYAVHPSWTRGQRFTIAQVIDDDPAETWYLTAGDGSGLSVSPHLRDHTPDATVSMSRDAFQRLLGDELVGAGERPVVRGDRDAVAHMRAWTQRAQGS